MLVGTGIDVILLGYGLAAYPSSRGAKGEDLLLEALLVVLLFLYFYAALFGTREYDPGDHWIHRQGIVFGLAVGALWAGELLNGSLGDTAYFGSLRSVNFGVYQAIGQAFIASVPVLLLLAAGRAGRKTGQMAAGVRVGLSGQKCQDRQHGLPGNRPGVGSGPGSAGRLAWPEPGSVKTLNGAVT